MSFSAYKRIEQLVASGTLHHAFPITALDTPEDKMQTGEILQCASNRFQDRLAASGVSGCFCFASLLHVHWWLQLTLLSRRQFRINPFTFSHVHFPFAAFYFLLSLSITSVFITHIYLTHIPGTNDISDPVNIPCISDWECKWEPWRKICECTYSKRILYHYRNTLHETTINICLRVLFYHDAYFTLLV